MRAQEYWDQVYREHPFLHGKAPLPFLVRMLPRLQKGKVLEVAMGEGQNAVYLAQKGFQVRGIDLSLVAVERAQNLARDTGVTIDTKVTDLDLFVMGLMEYDSIVMTFFKPPVSRYYSEIIRALKQGGTLLIHSYSVQEQPEAYGQDESYKNFYFTSNELLHHLRGLRLLFYHEGEEDGRQVVQCLAQKPFDKDAAKYNLFGVGVEAKADKPDRVRELAENLFKKK